jgi:hypothetical protein
LQAQIFSGKKVLALAMNCGTFYIFSAVRQFGSFYSALSLSRQPLQASLKDRQLDNKPTETEDENANASQN